MKVLRSRQRIAAVGAEAVFVVHDPPDRVRAGILADLAIPWPVTASPTAPGGSAARAWPTSGCPRRCGARYARLLASGERLRRLGRDTLQLGGDFVVDPHGRIAYARPQRRDDRPPVGVLLIALERAARGGPPSARPPAGRR